MKIFFTVGILVALGICSLMPLNSGIVASEESRTASDSEDARNKGIKSLEVLEGIEFFGGSDEVDHPGNLYTRIYGEVIIDENSELSSARAVKSLLSKDLEKRLKAYEKLQQTRAERSQALVNNLKALSKDPSRAVGGRFNMNVIAAGRLRIEEAVPVLLPKIDFTLDPSTFPVGLFSPMFYPVAEALVEIGGQKVVTGVLQQLSQPADPERLFVSAWVLQEVLGRQAAQAAVVHTMKEIAVLGDTRHKTNLSQVKQLLGMKDGIFLEGWFPSKIRERASSLLDSHEGESQKRESPNK